MTTTREPALELLIHTVLLACDTGPFRHAWTRDPLDGGRAGRRPRRRPTV